MFVQARVRFLLHCRLLLHPGRFKIAAEKAAKAAEKNFRASDAEKILLPLNSPTRSDAPSLEFFYLFLLSSLVECSPIASTQHTHTRSRDRFEIKRRRCPSYTSTYCCFLCRLVAQVSFFLSIRLQFFSFQLSL
jgi:hypothetical protein